MKMQNLIKTIYISLIILLFSCTEKINIPIEVSLNIKESYMDLGEGLKIIALDETGTDISSNAEFTISGEASPLINVNIFTPKEIGEYIIKCKYKNTYSTEDTIYVFEAASYDKKNFIENFVSTDCGSCPRLFYAIDLLKENSMEVNIVNIYSDKFSDITKIIDLKKHLNKEYEPLSYVNRNFTWTNPEHSNLNEVFSLKGQKSHYMISNSFKGDVSSQKASIYVEYTKPALGSYLNAYLLEDNIIETQVNYTEFFGSPAANLIDYTHNNVLRDIISPIEGEKIIYDSPTSSGNFTSEFPLSTQNKGYIYENLKLLIFVTDKNGEIINSYISKLN